MIDIFLKSGEEYLWKSRCVLKKVGKYIYHGPKYILVSNPKYADGTDKQMDLLETGIRPALFCLK